MNVRCMLGIHGRQYASGGPYIMLSYCPRCNKPDNNLCHQLISIERELWMSVNQQTGPEWDQEGKDAVVLRELMKYAGYDENGGWVAFYYDTSGYKFDMFRNFWTLRPTKRAEEMAKRLAENHPLAHAG